MSKHQALELPIRSKLYMLDDIVQLIHYLHVGKKALAAPLIKDLKLRSLFLEAPIQHAVLMFVEQICFQYEYDPWHKITPDVQKAADKLIEELGFTI